MKKILCVIILLVLLISEVKAQNIQITKFERNITNLIASTNPVYDNAGEACAMVRFFVRDMGFTIEANLGVVKTDTLSGEIRLWIPTGTKRITVRHEGMLPLSGYEIPIRIESKATYEATIDIEERKEKKESNAHVFLEARYNVMTLAGPEVGLGFEVKNHVIEVNAVYGLKKSDDLFFYDKDGNMNEAYSYQPFRLGLRYGYEIEIIENVLAVVPQVGCAYNLMSGKGVASTVSTGDDYKTASSFSALGALRLQVALGNHLKLYVTPEYDYGLYKDDNCKWISDYDKTFKGWTDGFNLSVGLNVSF